MAAGALACLYTDPIFVSSGLAAIAIGAVLHVVRRRAASARSVAI
jgi:hypothetical protein